VHRHFLLRSQMDFVCLRFRRFWGFCIETGIAPGGWDNSPVRWCGWRRYSCVCEEDGGANTF